MGKGNLPPKYLSVGSRTQRLLRFVWNSNGDGSADYIDIAQALSAVNARHYRQGLYYYVKSIRVHNTGDCLFQFNTIPDTWHVKQAWLRGKRIWDDMNKRALQGSSRGQYPKYHDYKVSMNDPGSDTTYTNNLLTARSADVGGSANLWTSDEWILSRYITEDPDLSQTTPSNAHFGDTFVAHMIGDHSGSTNNVTSYGLIKGYSETRRRRPSLGEPELTPLGRTDELANLFDAADTFDDIIENLDDDNDIAPYNIDTVVGSVSQLRETTQAGMCATGGGASSVAGCPGFMVPLGLLQIVTQVPGGAPPPGSVEIVVELAPGPYHGVYAENIE